MTHFPADDRRHLATRLSVMQGAIAVVFALLAVGFWVFQVAQHQKFRTMADNNHMRRLPMPAPRGVVFDRHGAVLVDNQYMYNITLDREQSKNIDQTLRILAQATGMPEAELRENYEQRRREPGFRPLVLIENASRAQVIAMMARKSALPGVDAQHVPRRHYPGSDMAAHVFGYVTEVREAQLARAEYEGVEPGARVGQTGVELAYNRLLMGDDGARAVVVNSVGREILEVERESRLPVEGRRLQLTIDADVQRATEEGFRHFGYNGAAVILDPQSGEILALVSLPAYNPADFALGIDPETWRRLTTDRLRPLQNRALQGRYSPGSTFKIAIAVAALEEKVITPEQRIFCPGGATFFGRFFKCWLAGGHGSVAMREALERSCNTYFYTVGNMLGVDRIHKWAAALGLGEMSGIDLPGEVQGLVPSTEWKERVIKERWYPGETISVAIGQGQVSVTPLSLAVMMMTVANGGTRYTPHLLKAVDEGQGWKPVPPPAPQSVVQFRKSTYDAVHEGLWMVINRQGTGGRGRIEGYNVAGKTGTSQVVSNQNKAAVARTGRDVRDHGWFVFFAPHDKPEIAGVIFAEHAEHGYLGAPIAKYAMETFFAKKEGRPLPSLQKPAAPVVAATNGAAPPGGQH